MPQYLQNVIGLTPTAAGLTLVIFMIALNISAGTSGYVLGRVVHYKMLPMVGLASRSAPSWCWPGTWTR